MEPGTLGLEGRDVTTAPTPPLLFMRVQSTEQTKAHAIIRRNGNEFPNFSLGIIEAVSKRLAQIFCQVLWMEDLNPSPGPAVLSSSESPHAGVLHLQNSQQVSRFQPKAMNSLFSNCHLGNLQVFMGNNSAGFH